MQREMVMMSSEELPTFKEIKQFVTNAGSADITYFGGKYMGGICIMQHPEEIAGLIHGILESGKVINDYLEIGAAAGGTTFIVNKYLQPSRIILIDDNSNDRSVYRPDTLKDIEYTEIIGHSHSDGTIDVLRSLDTKFDLIFIDANHTYEAVRGDVDIYKDFLRIGGLIAMHDTAMSQLGAMRTVLEMRQEPWCEYIMEYRAKSIHVTPCGITVFRKVM